MAFHVIFTQAAARGAQAARYGAQGVAKGARTAGKGVGGVLKGIRRGGRKGAQAAVEGGRVARGGAAGAMRQGARGAGRAVPTPRVRGAPAARRPPARGAGPGATSPASPRGAWRAGPAGAPVRGVSPAARSHGSGGPKGDGPRGGGLSTTPRKRELVGGGPGPAGRLRRRVLRGGRGGGDGGRRRGVVAPARRAALRSGQLALVEASRSFGGGDDKSLPLLGGSDQPTGRVQRGARRALGLAAVLPTLPLRPVRFVLRPRRTAKRVGRRVGGLLLSASVVLVAFSVLTVVMSFTDDGMAEVAPAILPALGEIAMGGGPTDVAPGAGGGCGGLDPSDVQERTRGLGRSGDRTTEIPPQVFAAYCAAAAAFGVDWAILAAIGWRECQHGRYRAAGCHPEGSVNSAGARGPMQFLGSTWRGSAGTHDPDVAGPPVCFRRGERRPQDPGDAASSGTGGDSGTTGDTTDTGDDPGEDGGPRDESEDDDSAAPPGDGGTGDPGTGNRDDSADHGRCERGAGYGTDGDRDGVADPWDWYDATYSAARLLLANRVDEDVDRAVFAYNHSDAYVEEVTRMAAAYREALGIRAPNGASLDGVARPAGVTPRGGTELYRDGHNTPTMQKVLDAVITHFGRSLGVGCFRAGDQDHGLGKACDVMVARGGRRPSEVMQRHGQALADWLVASAEALGVQYVIWEQRIWNIDLADEGWRRMGDRGSITQNHDDHVHISVQR